MYEDLRTAKGVMVLEDREIVELYWERSEKAISETDRKYKELCLHIADNILRDRSDAEECLNDTYLAAWSSIPTHRPKYFQAFICRLIKNISLKRYRRNTAQKRNPEVALSLDELADVIPSDEDVEAGYDSRELGAVITAFLKKRSRLSRVIFLRRYWYYDSIAEIALKYDMSESSVRQRLFRTRRQLREYLEKEGMNNEKR